MCQGIIQLLAFLAFINGVSYVVATGEFTKFDVDAFLNSVQNSQDWEHPESFLDQGPMMNYFDYETTLEIYNSSATLWPEVVSKPFSFGKTYLGNDMHAIALTLRKGNLEDSEAILIDSLHHGREMLSLSMQIYAFTRVLYDYLHNDPSTIKLLRSSVIWFIPAVNVDALIKLRSGEILRKKNSVRKNFNRGDCRIPDEGGVDLNRNYDSYFGIDTEGSSSNPCKEDYRGKQPFSEPETQAMRDFIEKRKNIRIAFNFHSYGNMWIRPVNYKKDSANQILKSMHKEYKVYQEFDQEAIFSNDATKGNAMETLGKIFKSDYLANGEGTDWMLLNKKIIAMSPEIGDENCGFFPIKSQIIPNIRVNYPPLHYMLHKILFEPQLLSSMLVTDQLKGKFLSKVAVVEKEEKGRVRVVSFEIFNRGVGSIRPNEKHSFIDFGLIPAEGTITLLNAFSIDYDDNFREERLQKHKGIFDLYLQDLIEFNLLTVSLNKIVSPSAATDGVKQENNQSPLQDRLKKSSVFTHRFPFSSGLAGRTYRRFFVVFKPNDTAQPMEYQLNMNVTATLNHDENIDSFLLSSAVSNKSQLKNEQNGHNDKDDDEIPSDLEQEDENEETVQMKSSSDDFIHTSFILIAVILSLFIIAKCISRKREKTLISYVHEMEDSNIVEIN